VRSLTGERGGGKKMASKRLKGLQGKGNGYFAEKHSMGGKSSGKVGVETRSSSRGGGSHIPDPGPE